MLGELERQRRNSLDKGECLIFAFQLSEVNNWMSILIDSSRVANQFIFVDWDNIFSVDNINFSSTEFSIRLRVSADDWVDFQMNKSFNKFSTSKLTFLKHFGIVKFRFSIIFNNNLDKIE